MTQNPKLQLTAVVSKALGLRVLKALHAAFSDSLSVVTCDDSTDVERSRLLEILGFCRSSGLPISVLDRQGLEEHLLVTQPDVAVVVGWYWIIGPTALEAPRLGCVGIHNSLLPAYRGGAPLVWSLIAGERRVGSSLFVLSTEMDEGDLLHQWAFDVHETDTCTDILQTIEDAVSSDLPRLISEYVHGNLIPKPQPTVGISYGAQRSPSDSRLDWSRSSTQICNLARALQPPYPRLFFDWRGARVEVAKVVPASFRCFGEAGQMVAWSDRGALVGCGVNGDGVLLERVVTNGQTLDLATVRPFPLGARFGLA